MKYCEDLLFQWDKRIQFEAVLLFFFSVISGSSFISINMFYQTRVILMVIPILYTITMFCWWYLCKRLVFNTHDPHPNAMFYTNGVSFILWLIITAAVSFGGWDEWGWKEKDVDVPAADNIYRLINCLLVTFYIAILTFDFYKKFENRTIRIKFWSLFIWIHSIISFAYFIEWVIDAHNSNNYESIAGRYLATLGSGILIIWGCTVFCTKKLNPIQLYTLLCGLVLYWWGSASLDCEFYADTADMTVMPGYQMLWSMSILLLLESLPSMSLNIYILGTELLIDQELDNTKIQTELINVDDVDIDLTQPQIIQTIGGDDKDIQEEDDTPNQDSDNENDTAIVENLNPTDDVMP